MAIETSPRQPVLAVDAPPGGTGGPTWMRSSDLKKRIWFTLGALAVYRLGTYIPLPGVDSAVMARIAAESYLNRGKFFMFPGSEFVPFTILNLGILSYIHAAIFVQLLMAVWPYFRALNNESAAGRRTINQIVSVLAMALAAWHGYGLAIGLEWAKFDGQSAVVQGGPFFRLTAVMSLVAGTAFLIWLGEQITARGVGNGIALILFAGIVADLPSALAETFEMSHRGTLPPLLVLGLMVCAVVVIMLIIFVERAQRRFVVQYPERRHGDRVFPGETTFIPLKVNSAGVVPPIFASSVLLAPLMFANIADSGGAEWLDYVYSYVGRGQVSYLVLYSGLITWFAFLYSAAVFNPKRAADSLKRLGGVVSGVRPGRNTADHFRLAHSRLTWVAAAYLAFICVLPDFLIANYAVPFYFGGASLLIVVTVTMDTFAQMQSHLLAARNDKVTKK